RTIVHKNHFKVWIVDLSERQKAIASYLVTVPRQDNDAYFWFSVCHELYKSLISGSSPAPFTKLPHAVVAAHITPLFHDQSAARTRIPPKRLSPRRIQQ